MGSAFSSAQKKSRQSSEDDGVNVDHPPPTRTTRSSSHNQTNNQNNGNHGNHGTHQQNTSSSSSSASLTRNASAAMADNSAFTPARCSLWFDSYKDKELSETIGPEGIESLCNDLAVTPDNVVMLIIAWKLGAATMGYFTKEEWMGGMRKMNCDTTQKLKNHLPKLPMELNDPASFKDLYRYSFDFSKEKTQKSMDVNIAIAIWMMLMKERSQHTQQFIEFLEEKTPVKVINRDQWMNFLEFCEAVKSDLSNYDENSAWPVLLDEYVGWIKDRQM